MAIDKVKKIYMQLNFMKNVLSLVKMLNNDIFHICKDHCSDIKTQNFIFWTDRKSKFLWFFYNFLLKVCIRSIFSIFIEKY